MGAGSLSLRSVSLASDRGVLVQSLLLARTQASGVVKRASQEPLLTFLQVAWMCAFDGLCLPCSTQPTRRCCRITLLEVDDRTSTLGHAEDPRGISDGAKRVAAYHYWMDTGASWYGQTRNKEMTVHLSAGCLHYARDVSGSRDANGKTGLPHGSAGSSPLDSLLGDGGDGTNQFSAVVDTGMRLWSRRRWSSWPSAFFVQAQVPVCSVISSLMGYTW